MRILKPRGAPRGYTVEATGSTQPSLPAWRRAARFRRLFLAVAVIGQTGIASYYFSRVLPHHGGTLVELGLLVLFALLFAWISVGFWVAVNGFMLRLRGGDRHSLLHRHSDVEWSSVPARVGAALAPEPGASKA